MKLINADKLIEDFRNTITEQSDTFDWLNMISRQPIAYDVDDVLDKIEAERKEAESYGYSSVAIAHEIDIEIVKSGYIE